MPETARPARGEGERLAFPIATLPSLGVAIMSLLEWCAEGLKWHRLKSKSTVFAQREHFFHSKISSFSRNELGTDPLFSITSWLRSYYFDIFFAFYVP